MGNRRRDTPTPFSSARATGLLPCPPKPSFPLDVAAFPWSLMQRRARTDSLGVVARGGGVGVWSGLRSITPLAGQFQRVSTRGPVVGPLHRSQGGTKSGKLPFRLFAQTYSHLIHRSHPSNSSGLSTCNVGVDATLGALRSRESAHQSGRSYTAAPLARQAPPSARLRDKLLAY